VAPWFKFKEVSDAFTPKRKFDFSPPATMPTRYLFVFAQAHVEFRIPELVSIAELNGFTIIFPDIHEERDPTRPFMILGLEEDEHARIFARRCILVKYISEFCL